MKTGRREQVFERDRHRCRYCGTKVSRKTRTIDHVRPKALGGTDGMANLVTSCFPCNQRKADKTLEESGMALLEIGGTWPWWH